MVLALHASELLAYGAALECELRGQDLGLLSATAALNVRCQRRWGVYHWWALLAPHYRRLTGDRRSETARNS